MTKTLEQRTLAYETLDHIEANPGKHDQNWWLIRSDNPTTGAAAEVMNDCGSTACYCGWTVLLAGGEFIGRYTVRMPGGGPWDVAALGSRLLGLTDYEAEVLFWQANDLADVRKAVSDIFGPRPDGA